MTVQEVVKDCGWKRGCVAEWAGVVPATMVAHRTTEILQALHRFVSEVHCAVPQPAPGDPSRHRCDHRGFLESSLSARGKLRMFPHALN